MSKEKLKEIKIRKNAEKEKRENKFGEMYGYEETYDHATLGEGYTNEQEDVYSEEY